MAAKYAVGTRVAGEAHKGCGICQNCMTGHYTVCLNYGDNASGHRHYGFTSQGAYAEYIVTSVKSATPLPEGLDLLRRPPCSTRPASPCTACSADA